MNLIEYFRFKKKVIAILALGLVGFATIKFTIRKLYEMLLSYKYTNTDSSIF